MAGLRRVPLAVDVVVAQDGSVLAGRGRCEQSLGEEERSKRGAGSGTDACACSPCDLCAYICMCIYIYIYI